MPDKEHLPPDAGSLLVAMTLKLRMSDRKEEAVMSFSALKSKWFCFLLLINVMFGVALERSVHQYNQFIASAEQSEKERVVSLTKKAASDLGNVVQVVEKQAQKLADTFSVQQNLSPAAIEKQLSDELDINTDLLGCGVMYGPYAYRKDKYLFYWPVVSSVFFIITAIIFYR